MTNLHRILAFIVIMSLLFGSQVPQVIENSVTTINQVAQTQQNVVYGRAYWLGLATNAWKYFQPGVNVDAGTGLHYSSSTYRYFTDWDLAAYIQATVDAARLGIIGNSGDWGFDYRINKILTFLESRPLTSSGVPYVWYSPETGQNTVDDIQNAADAANLLVALKNVENYRPNFASRVEQVVNNKTNYEPLKQAVDVLKGSVNIYDYYSVRAFASFWPSRFSAEASQVLNNILNAPTVNYQGVNLPKAKLMCETLLLSAFELSYDANFMKLARLVYLAHEARYNATGHFAAFSEGGAPPVAELYVWEWVIIPDGHTWVVQTDETTSVDITPCVFLKAAVGLRALYDTRFTANMVNTMEPNLATSQGYLEGVGENGQTLSSISDKTNSMIIGAARYAINNNNNASASTPPTTPTPPTPTPAQSQTRTQTPPPTPTQTQTNLTPPPASTSTAAPSAPLTPGTSPGSPSFTAPPTNASSPTAPTNTPTYNPSATPSKTAIPTIPSPLTSPSAPNPNKTGGSQPIIIAAAVIIGLSAVLILIYLKRRVIQSSLKKQRASKFFRRILP